MKRFCGVLKEIPLKKLMLAVALFCALPLAVELAAQTKTDEAKAPEKAEVQLTAAQLDAVSGEYVDAKEPDTPASFYAQDGSSTWCQNAIRHMQ